MSTHDTILLGAGHNALVLQAYLARCGLKTLCLDRADVAGGGLATVDNPRLEGFVHHGHSFFHRGITSMPWYRDLGLEARGVRYIEPERNVVLLLEDGRTLEWWTDPERTAASFGAFSQRDAETLRRWIEEFQPIVDEILIPEAQSPPLEPEERRRRLGGSKLGRRLLEISSLSPLEFVEREFEDDTVRAGLLFFNGLREIDLRLHGFGHAIPALLAARQKAQMCVGGSGELARGLVEEIEAHGGEMRCGVEIRRIVVSSGRACGVELADGERLSASRCVVSGLNPQQTYLDLLEETSLAGELKRKAEGFRYNLLAPLFALHLALDEAPHYRSIDATDGAPAPPFLVILGLSRFAQFERIVDAHERGVLPPPVAWGACPTLFDATQAPPGKHTAFLWEKVPFALRGDPRHWEAERERHAVELLRLWERHAPNLGGAVLDRWAQTPVDTELALPNMRGGDLLVGSFAHGQVGYDRPFPGAGHYRSGVEGLYLCGGSCHPGGNVTGLCGYNAASVIAADLGLEAWWKR